MEDNQVQQTNTGTEETEPQVQDNQPKMVSMTQQELDDLIAKRLSRQERKLQEAFDKKLNELSEAQNLHKCQMMNAKNMIMLNVYLI